MLTIKELLKGVSNINALNEEDLVKISDKLWEMGDLEEIKGKVSPELFNLHICLNLIGNWKEGGWWFILGEMGMLVPYVSTALETLNLFEMKTAFTEVMKNFPEYTVFDSNDATYIDIINFLQNVRFKVEDKRLESISAEKRKEMVMQLRKSIDVLEDLTELSWGENSEGSGWKQVLEFISNRNTLI